MSGAPAGGTRVVEVKRRLVGPTERYECELVHRTPSLVVARYRVERPPWAEPGSGHPRGQGEGPLDSYGCFWRRRPYLCYHMVRADGSEAVTRFDVVRDVRLDVAGPDAGGEVSYTDLLLDLWVEPASPMLARWEDEDEVAAAAREGLLTAADLALIARARALLTRRHRRVVGELRRLLRSLGRLPALPPALPAER